MPLELAKLQTWFFRELQPGAPRERVRQHIAGTKALPAKARLEIYADMYLARLIDSLAQEFPRLVEAMGGECFDQLARAYLAKHPSRRPTIQHVGEKLPAFLAAQLKAGAFPQFPFASELAKLEQAAGEAFVAAEPAGVELLTREHLQAVAPEAWPTLTFRVTPTLDVLKLRFGFPKGHAPVAKPVVVRVWRKAFEVFEAPMEPFEQRALRAAQEGKPFAEVCLAAGSAEKAATLLATWVEEGMLQGSSIR